jgi:hypothetical protein
MPSSRSSSTPWTCDWAASRSSPFSLPHQPLSDGNDLMLLAKEKFEPAVEVLVKQ